MQIKKRITMLRRASTNERITMLQRTDNSGRIIVRSSLFFVPLPLSLSFLGRSENFRVTTRKLASITILGGVNWQNGGARRRKYIVRGGAKPLERADGC